VKKGMVKKNAATLSVKKTGVVTRIRSNNAPLRGA
jgi:hypothetical protein